MTGKKKLLARIITEDFGLLSLKIMGFQKAVQAVQVDVWQAGQGAEHHLVVFANYPEIDPCSCEEMETRLDKDDEGIIISFVVSDEPGKSILFVSPKQQGQSSLLNRATAIAVVKQSWGWDESEVIRMVDETTGKRIELKNPVYENGHFEIEI